jgi:putative spermidine/putrescine transport system ATP-binding protein
MRDFIGLASSSPALVPETESHRPGAAVSIDGLGRRYGDLVALHPTSLEIAAGEFFSLIGPSGSGKTTLLGAIAGFLAPSCGDIRVDGNSIVKTPPYRRNIGMVFQNYSLFPHMNVFDNIAFPLRMRKLSKRDIETRVRRMLDVVRLPDVGERIPTQLSGGQQQRIALARAAIYDPPLLLMDEPLGALDKNLREEMQFEIKQFHHAIGTTILYVTHDQDEAATMSDRIAILNHGRIEQAGTPRELYEQPTNAFVASFLGQANMFEVASITLGSGGTATARARNGMDLVAAVVPSDRRSLVACVRPEAIALAEHPLAMANSFSGVLRDQIYTAGSVGYRIVVGDMTIAVRKAARRKIDQFTPGMTVYLGWEATDTLLIPTHNEEMTDEKGT